MNVLGNVTRITVVCAVLAGAVAGRAQTFEVNGEKAQTPASASKPSQGKSSAASPSSAAPQSSEGIGWGSSIEVARQARAAQDALNRGDYNAAVAYAERAAKAAPQRTDFWFLLGFSARLAGQYSVSVDAYKRGLATQPSSIQGLSGLAQTYARMGRDDDAKTLLLQVLAANPRSANDLNLAGELFLASDPQRALDLLRRADGIQPSARSELLMARAYRRLKQPDMAKRMLESARNRDPKNPEVLRAVAGFYRDAGQYDLAISTLKSVPNKTPEVLAELGFSYQLAGKRREAADTYAQAANGATKSLPLQLSAAQAAVNASELPRAQGFLKRAAAIDSNHYRLHAILGQVAAFDHHTDDAIREYQLALQRLPEGVPEGVLYPIELRLSLYQLYQDNQDEAAAQQQIEAARAQMSKLDFQDANRPEFLRLRAAVESASNDYAAAEKDLKEASSLDPSSVNIILNYANLLRKMDRPEESKAKFEQALKLDPTNGSAIASLGYLARETGDSAGAKKYFTQLAQQHPDDYVAYLALGDLFTSAREFSEAQANYEKAHLLAPTNPLVVAGGVNAALEDHKLPVARKWLDRADAKMKENPQLMREHERYLTFAGQYAESAQLGYKVIEKLPRDPEAPVYLAYDLLYLERYDDAMNIVHRFGSVLPRDKDLPLIAGYVHTHYGLLNQAVDDFTRALEHSPEMSTGYVNRGFVLNDLKEAQRAAQDFEKALKLRPDYGEAHLGLAFAYLQLRRSKPALKEADAAQSILGESKATHLARAESYRQQVLLASAEKEYQAALKFAPDEEPIFLALADAQYRQRHYNDSIATLKIALSISPDDSYVYAALAQSYARLRQRDETIQAINSAAHGDGGKDAKVQLAIGDALLDLGETKTAMDWYGRALEAPDGDRLGTRLAIARLFVRRGKWNDAKEQVGLGFAEARVGESEPITADHLLQAAAIFMSIHDYELAQKYFDRSQAAGADSEVVAIGLANAYLAQGQTASAQTELASLGNAPELQQDYDYLMAKGNVYRQQHDTMHALTSFARASALTSDSEPAQQAEFELAGQEGRQITENLSIVPRISLAPIFEDINIYTMDAKLRAATPGNLPLPRSSYETLANAGFRLHFEGLPTISGFLQERNARGRLSFPSELLIQDRDTYDTSFNSAISPVLKLGDNSITFTPGLQFTIRRDTISPADLNQNLFRQFLYVNTSPFWNWLSFSGSLIHESGPFTERDLHSRDVSATLGFTVGRPWGRTALVTGYLARDILFRPLIREYFTTSTYVGVEHQFGDKVRATVLGEYLRSWRVQDNFFAIAQAMRPAVRVEYKPNMRWTVEGAMAFSRGEGSHFYDNVQNEFLISYVKPIRGALEDGTGSTTVNYPLRFSVGLQQQTFYNFPGQSRSTFLPVIRVTLF